MKIENNYECEIISCNKISSDVYVVTLKAPANQPFDFQSGQYLLVRMSENDARPYSIASAFDQQQLELHIKDIPGNDFTGEVLSKLKKDKSINVNLPLGSCTIDKSSGLCPILFITGGTGFSHSHAIIQSLLDNDDSRSLYLYWGANSTEEFYLNDKAIQWHQQYENFNFIPVINNPPDDWDGEEGMVHEAVFRNISQLQDYDIYLSGSSAMVFNIYRALRNHKVPSKQIFSDMLDILRENNEQDFNV